MIQHPRLKRTFDSFSSPCGLQWVPVIKEAEILGEALDNSKAKKLSLLLESRSILSRRLSFLAVELSQQPSVSQGGKGMGGVTTCVN